MAVVCLRAIYAEAPVNGPLMTKRDGADIKAEIIKWMFLFWIGQIAVLIAAAHLLFSA